MSQSGCCTAGEPFAPSAAAPQLVTRPLTLLRRLPMGEVAKLAVPSSAVAGKELYEIGEIPPLGHVPVRMYAWTIGGNSPIS